MANKRKGNSTQLTKMDVAKAKPINSASESIAPPDILARYNEVLPGAAERILRITEANVTHKMDIERIEKVATIKQLLRGQIIGATIAFVGLICSCLLFLNDHFLLGSIFSAPTLILLVKLFVSETKDPKL